MPYVEEDIRDPIVVIRWLRWCGDKIDRCHKCPYGCLDPGPDDRSCMDVLHQEAADLIERLNKSGR